ncbi:hypothetical protein NpNSSI1_00003077 [Neofusicoccum parvum]|nr:hypothetical protein NpNSSI1_00003077 [Neofusicoccum parvum]
MLGTLFKNSQVDIANWMEKIAAKDDDELLDQLNEIINTFKSQWKLLLALPDNLVDQAPRQRILDAQQDVKRTFAQFVQTGKDFTHVEVSNVIREDQQLSAFPFLLTLDKSEWLGVMTKVKDQGWLDEHEDESPFAKYIHQIGKSSAKLQEVAAAVRELGTDPVTGKGEKLLIGTKYPFNARMIYYFLREDLHVAEGEVCLLTKDSRKSTQEIHQVGEPRKQSYRQR